MEGNIHELEKKRTEVASLGSRIVSLPKPVLEVVKISDKEDIYGPTDILPDEVLKRRTKAAKEVTRRLHKDGKTMILKDFYMGGDPVYEKCLHCNEEIILAGGIYSRAASPNDIEVKIDPTTGNPYIDVKNEIASIQVASLDTHTMNNHNRLTTKGSYSGVKKIDVKAIKHFFSPYLKPPQVA